MKWVLAVYVAGNLLFVSEYSTREACEAAGQAAIKGKVNTTYVCGEKKIYRPK